ncbi:DDE superfamily endonuclease, partial [Phytophthora infestans]
MGFLKASSITSRKAVQSRILGQQQVLIRLQHGSDSLQKKAYCDEVRMLQWIEEVWRPSISGSKLLMLDSLKTHKMEFVREKLENGCCTEVEFIPPGTTGIAQPMDVSVMQEFKRICRDLYVGYHKDHDFAPSPEACRDLITRVVVRVWQLNDADVIVRGFIRAGVVPYGPRNKDARFH